MPRCCAYGNCSSVLRARQVRLQRSCETDAGNQEASVAKRPLFLPRWSFSPTKTDRGT
jgi:hypothetical protein